MKLLIEESVLRQALNYLETAAFRDSDRDEAITALRTALDAAEKVEPVAWMFEYDGMVHDKFNPPVFSMTRKSAEEPWTETPLYTHPAPAVPEETK